jgi:hypothetical protein
MPRSQPSRVWGCGNAAAMGSACAVRSLEGRSVRCRAQRELMRHERTATGVWRAYDSDGHVQQRGRECGWSTSEPQSQQRKPNVGGHGRPSASRMAAPPLIRPPLHASRRCRQPATIVGRSPTPCSLTWRWSTKFLVRRSIGLEVRGAAWDIRTCPRGDGHVRPRLDDVERSTLRMASVCRPPHIVSTLLTTLRGVGPTRATTAST